MRNKHAQPTVEKTTDPETGNSIFCTTWEPKIQNRQYFILQISHELIPAEQITCGSSPNAIAEMIHALVAWHNKLSPTHKHITIHDPGLPAVAQQALRQLKQRK